MQANSLKQMKLFDCKVKKVFFRAEPDGHRIFQMIICIRSQCNYLAIDKKHRKVH